MKRISLLTIGSLLFLLLATPQQSFADEEILIEETIVCPTEPAGLAQKKVSIVALPSIAFSKPGKCMKIKSLG